MRNCSQYTISSAPFIRNKTSTSDIMRDVMIALFPAALFGIYRYGISAIILIVVCIFFCVFFEYIWQCLMGINITVNDGSAAVTGLLLALNLNSGFPLWMAVAGCFFAIIIIKQLFGGIGQNFMNPALGARCFLLISFADKMTSLQTSLKGIDGVSGATPLAIIKYAGRGVDVTGALHENGISMADMLFGNIGGTIGETSVFCLLSGAIYLAFRHVITWEIPVCYITSFSIFILLFGGHGSDMAYVMAEVCGGGLLLGAFFMATDYVTSPITPHGRILYGLFLGILTGIFRIYGTAPEGVSYAIIIGNLIVPLIERITVPAAFGKEGI